MPEIHPDQFAKQYPNKYNPPENAYFPAPSSFFALLGGTFAALSSVSAKLAVSEHTELLRHLLLQLLPSAEHNTGLLATAERAVMVGSIAACNFFMWLFFTKALRFARVTSHVVMLQTVANFAVTALCGVYLFGNALSAQWWAGASMIAAGLVLLNTEKNVPCIHESPDHAFEINGYTPDDKKSQ
ncbi:hypothetical protein IW150_006269 [Coemansia sp. RSA 2607]|nr:hypothetical protein IW150_006269 [Coemansia sp. RSA 2607]